MKIGLHPDAESLYVEDVDLGEGQPRQVCRACMPLTAVILARELHDLDAASCMSPTLCSGETCVVWFDL